MDVPASHPQNVRDYFGRSKRACNCETMLCGQGMANLPHMPFGFVHTHKLPHSIFLWVFFARFVTSLFTNKWQPCGNCKFNSNPAQLSGRHCILDPEGNNGNFADLGSLVLGECLNAQNWDQGWSCTELSAPCWSCSGRIKFWMGCAN